MIATPDRSSATPQPWMRPPSTMPAKGSRFHALGVRQRLAVGMGEEDQAAAAAGAREARHDALAFARSIARALANSPTIGTSAGP